MKTKQSVFGIKRSLKLLGRLLPTFVNRTHAIVVEPVAGGVFDIVDHYPDMVTDGAYYNATANIKTFVFMGFVFGPIEVTNVRMVDDE